MNSIYWTRIEYTNDDGQVIERESDNWIITGNIFDGLLRTRGAEWVLKNVKVASCKDNGTGSEFNWEYQDVKKFI